VEDRPSNDEIDRRKSAYGALFSAVAEALFKADPIGVNFETNTDEYEPETSTILPRLKQCKDESEARRAIHEEFVAWFSPGTAGPEEAYTEAAQLVWHAWQTYRAAL
jgi:hypothetical protein